MAERDDRAAIGAAVHAFRLVLGRLADPAPRLRADLARAEALIDPDAPLPLLEFDPFEALPAEPLPPGHAPAGESWRDRAGSATPPASSAVQRAEQPGPQGTARAAPWIAREPAWTARDLPGAADTSLTAGPSSGGREGPPAPVVSFRRRHASAPGAPAPPAPLAPLAAVGADSTGSPGDGAPPEQAQASSGAEAALPAAPAAGMALLGQIAGEVLRAERRAAPAARNPARPATPLRGGPEVESRETPDATTTPPDWPAASGGAVGPGPVAQDGAGAAAPASSVESTPRGASAARPPQAPAEVVPAASEGRALGGERLDASELARLINDVLVEQAQRHGVDLS